MDKKKILIIDDDRKIGSLLTEYLSQFDYDVKATLLPQDGMACLKEWNPDLLVLDVMLPEKNGFTLCTEIRTFSSIPIIMLTARGEISDKVVGLEFGADDYLVKPFEPRELAARIQALLRRSIDTKQIKKEIIETSIYKIDFSRMEVFWYDEKLILTNAEFDLIKLFIQNKGRVLSRDEIMETIQGIQWESFNRSVDVLVSRVRNKIHDNQKTPQYIKTVWGVGYIFLDPEGH